MTDPFTPMLHAWDAMEELLEDERQYPDRMTFVRDDTGEWYGFITSKTSPGTRTTRYRKPGPTFGDLLDIVHEREIAS